MNGKIGYNDGGCFGRCMFGRKSIRGRTIKLGRRSGGGQPAPSINRFGRMLDGCQRGPWMTNPIVTRRSGERNRQDGQLSVVTIPTHCRKSPLTTDHRPNPTGQPWRNPSFPGSGTPWISCARSFRRTILIGLGRIPSSSPPAAASTKWTRCCLRPKVFFWSKSRAALAGCSVMPAPGPGRWTASRPPTTTP